MANKIKTRVKVMILCARWTGILSLNFSRTSNNLVVWLSFAIDHIRRIGASLLLDIGPIILQWYWPDRDKDIIGIFYDDFIILVVVF